MNLSLGDDEYDYWKAAAGKDMKQRLGVAADPLNDVYKHVCLIPRQFSSIFNTHAIE